MRLIGLLEIIGVTCFILFLFQNYVWGLAMGLLIHLMRWEIFGKQFVVISFLGNALMLYLIVGVLAQTVLAMHSHDGSLGWLLFYSAVCSTFIFGLVTQSLIGKGQDGVYGEEAEHGTAWQVRLDTVKALAAIPFFILSLLIPTLAVNPLTYGLFRLVLWVVGIPVLGLLLGIAGGLLALSMCWSGVIGLLGMGFVVGDKALNSRQGN